MLFATTVARSTNAHMFHALCRQLRLNIYTAHVDVTCHSSYALPFNAIILNPCLCFYAAFVGYLLIALILCPYLNKIHGIGSRPKLTKPSKLVAHAMPSFLYTISN